MQCTIPYIHLAAGLLKQVRQHTSGETRSGDGRQAEHEPTHRQAHPTHSPATVVRTKVTFLDKFSIQIHFLTVVFDTPAPKVVTPSLFRGRRDTETTWRSSTFDSLISQPIKRSSGIHESDRRGRSKIIHIGFVFPNARR